MENQLYAAAEVFWKTLKTTSVHVVTETLYDALMDEVSFGFFEEVALKELAFSRKQIQKATEKAVKAYDRAKSS